MPATIEHDAALHRFLIHYEGEEAGVAEYERQGDVWSFTHTEVQSQFSGRGLAGELVGHALDTVVADGWRIRAACPFVATFVNERPQYSQYLVD